MATFPDTVNDDGIPLEGQPLVSVIVPVFNQWDLVPSLLGCLEKQVLVDGSFELLLVDNGSDWMPPADKLPAYARRLICHAKGSYVARNHGAAHAAGKYLAFTDADCRPRANWLRSLHACLSGGTERIAAGRVDVIAEEPVTLAARYDLALAFPVESYVARGYGVTANLAVSRVAFERAGGFDAERLSGGDAEFCWRSRQRGIAVTYCPEAVVLHPARRSMAELIRKVRRLKGGQLRSGAWHRRVACALRGFLPPLRAWWRIWHAPRLTVADRVAVSFVQARLWLTEMTETLRLLSGRTAERR